MEALHYLPLQSISLLHFNHLKKHKYVLHQKWLADVSQLSGLLSTLQVTIFTHANNPHIPLGFLAAFTRVKIGKKCAGANTIDGSEAKIVFHVRFQCSLKA